MTTTRRGRRKPGRPPKIGPPQVDPATINPRAVLAGIAADPQSPPTARVMACKALLRLAEDTDTTGDNFVDGLNQKALARMGNRTDER